MIYLCMYMQDKPCTRPHDKNCLFFEVFGSVHRCTPRYIHWIFVPNDKTCSYSKWWSTHNTSLLALQSTPVQEGPARCLGNREKGQNTQYPGRSVLITFQPFILWPPSQILQAFPICMCCEICSWIGQTKRAGKIFSLSENNCWP